MQLRYAVKNNNDIFNLKVQRYLLVTESTVVLLTENFCTRWYNGFCSMSYIHSGFTRVFGGEAMDFAQSQGIDLRFENSLTCVLRINNRKKAMVTRLRFNF